MQTFTFLREFCLANNRDQPIESTLASVPTTTTTEPHATSKSLFNSTLSWGGGDKAPLTLDYLQIFDAHFKTFSVHSISQGQIQRRFAWVNGRNGQGVSQMASSYAWMAVDSLRWRVWITSLFLEPMDVRQHFPSSSLPCNTVYIESWRFLAMLGLFTRLTNG